MDYAAPKGAQVVAAIAGQIRWRDYGQALGGHQFSISPDPGEPFGDGEVFYAHTYDRPPDGSWVNVGFPVAHVGTEGNVTGPHLHFEWHPTPEGKNNWGCDVCANPEPVIAHNPSADNTPSIPSGVEMEEDDMFIVKAPNRTPALLGPGYAKDLNDEEVYVLTDLGVRLEEHNERGYDVARGAVLYGEATD